MRPILLILLPFALAACRETEVRNAAAGSENVVVLTDVNTPPPTPEPADELAVANVEH